MIRLENDANSVVVSFTHAPIAGPPGLKALHSALSINEFGNMNVVPVVFTRVKPPLRDRLSDIVPSCELVTDKLAESPQEKAGLPPPAAPVQLRIMPGGNGEVGPIDQNAFTPAKAVAFALSLTANSERIHHRKFARWRGIDRLRRIIMAPRFSYEQAIFAPFIALLILLDDRFAQRICVTSLYTSRHACVIQVHA